MLRPSPQDRRTQSAWCKIALKSQKELTYITIYIPCWGINKYFETGSSSCFKRGSHLIFLFGNLFHWLSFLVWMIFFMDQMLSDVTPTWKRKVKIWNIIAALNEPIWQVVSSYFPTSIIGSMVPSTAWVPEARKPTVLNYHRNIYIRDRRRRWDRSTKFDHVVNAATLWHTTAAQGSGILSSRAYRFMI